MFAVKQIGEAVGGLVSLGGGVKWALTLRDRLREKRKRADRTMETIETLATNHFPHMQIALDSIVHSNNRIATSLDRVVDNTAILKDRSDRERS